MEKGLVGNKTQKTNLLLLKEQNFKNLYLSISQRYQRLLSADCGFAKTHPLFSSEIKYGVLTDLKDDQKDIIWGILYEYLPGIALAGAFKKYVRLLWNI